MSTGAKYKSNQARSQADGVNLVGKTPTVRNDKVPAFQGRSGQPNNQDTNRGSGGR